MSSIRAKVKHRNLHKVECEYSELLIFAGLLPFLNDIRFYNDLGHPLCQNIREGLWLCDYIVKRLERFGDKSGCSKLGRIVRRMFEPLHDVPYDLRPCYFEAIYTRIYEAVFVQLMSKHNPYLHAYIHFDILSRNSLLSEPFQNQINNVVSSKIRAEL